GLEVLKQIKSTFPDQTVVMVTKSEERELMERAYGEWADGYIVKPFKFTDLLSVINRTIKRREIISRRIGESYTTDLRTVTTPTNYQEWITKYLKLITWDERLEDVDDPSLKEIHEDQKKEANIAFNHFYIENYPSFLKGDGPVLSHQVFKTWIVPLLREGPVYLFILDSMRLDQWLKITPILRDHFDIEPNYYFSILPSATPYSRNAIFSGLLPLEIYQNHPRYWVLEEWGQNRYEKELFDLQLKRLGIRGLRYRFLKVTSAEEIKKGYQQLVKGRYDLFIYVVNFFDLVLHSIPSKSEVRSLLRDEKLLLKILSSWFVSSPIFEAMKKIDPARKIVITSDHGFIRVKRPLLAHGGKIISANLRYKFGPALRTDAKGALILDDPKCLGLPQIDPSYRYIIAKEDYYFIYPTKPAQYEKEYKYTFQHGGISPEEIILPFAILRSKR
ncbi:MAG TPA: PglZ domain-containing protein, partial [bacterium (Candidatus Stahlbacteria)]|nr:PglZ domain-containing protein [Candidatus Stahlbacteria bacterium]